MRVLGGDEGTECRCRYCFWMRVPTEQGRAIVNSLPTQDQQLPVVFFEAVTD